MALSPSYSSILNNWLYFASLSLLAGAPVLICPQPRATTKSAMKVSSVYPERWETIVPQLFYFPYNEASIASVNEPIWFTFNNKAVQCLSLIPVSIRDLLVTKRSSPTIWMFYPILWVISFHPSTSSWSNGSSIEMIGYFFE